ncbi:MAG: secretin N-terminal domain-containing protein, partial [Chthoniobacterales bacterium]
MHWVFCLACAVLITAAAAPAQTLPGPSQPFHPVAAADDRVDQDAPANGAITKTALPAQQAPQRPQPLQAMPVAKRANAQAAEAAAAPPNPAPTARLQFPNSDIVDVLHYYEQLTGKKLVMDNFVQGKVNIFITKDVTRDEAIKIIEMSMALNGISLVPASTDIVEVVGAGQNPRKALVPIISDVSDIPPGNPVISFLFKLQYADPQELQQVLTAYFQGSSGSINILAVPKSSSLLVTHNADIVRQIATVIQQVDVAPAEVVSEFIKLERADAGKVVDMLKDIFEKGTQQPNQPSVRTVRVPQPLPQPVPQEGEAPGYAVLSEEAMVVGKIKLTADVRTNRIHVVTRPINMPFLRKLISEFDANVEFGKPVTRPLRYISASDVLPVLVQALSEPGTGGQAGAGPEAAASPGASIPPRRPPTGAVSSPYTTTGGFSSSGSSGTLNVSEELETQPVDTTPKAVTVGNTKIIADQRANTIVMLGNRDVVVKVEKILDEMDVKAPQVALSTVIGELTLNKDETFGVDYFVRHSRGLDVAGTTNFTGVPPATGGGTTNPNPSPSGAPITTGGTVFDPANLISFTQLATNAASGTNVYLAAGRTLAAVVHALETTGRFKVISRPMVFTSNNKKAIIASGTEIPVPVNTLTNVVNQTSVNGTAAVASNIEFKRVALQLEVVPLINSGKEVSLDILQKIDSVAGSTLVNGNAIPNIATRYIRTNVSAENGSTIVLGGLITDSKNKNYSGIPYLSRIPVLGALFRNTTDNKTRTELIILMCPEVSLTNLDLYRLRQRWEE